MSNTTSSNYYSSHFSHPMIKKDVSELLYSYLPSSPVSIIVLCIGTDRSTGDALGPMTGTFLEKHYPKHLHLYGTLHKPVHALNLETSIQKIEDTYNNPYIIAIDASLGRLNSIGHITTSSGPLLPGAAFQKKLPAVGDAHLTGIVNISGMMEYNILQGTKLSLVYDMAWTLTRILLQFDKLLLPHHYKTTTNRTAQGPLFKINGQYIE